jgi:hypothetical protein
MGGTGGLEFVGGGVRYAAAGPGFLGPWDVGARLRLDLTGNAVAPTGAQPLVVLDGRDGLRIGTGFTSLDAGWTHHEVPVSVAGGWVNLRQDRAATAEEIRTVLEHVVDLRIRMARPAVLDNVAVLRGSSPAGLPDGVPLATSSFAFGTEDWDVERHPNGSALRWEPEAGRDRSGALSWDHWNVSVNHFVAPPAFAEEGSDAYGGVLEFQVHGKDNTGRPDPLLVLVGLDGTELVAGFEEEGDGWLRYRASLDARGGWILSGSSRPATDAEIQDVLAGLAEIRIRTVFDNGGSYLDDVRLVGP